MKYYLLGKSGLRVAELALGAMSFGTEWGWGIEINAARKMLDLYIDNGGNFVDTANFYTNGSSEKMLGEFLGEKRQQIVLSTKYTMNTHPGDPNGGGNHRKSMVQLKQVFKDSRLITSTCSTCTSGMIRHLSKKFCERWMTLFARERFSTWEFRILLRGKSQECKPSPIFADGLRL
jgi:diketogulonate reductase-like aldo/keto reductase